MPTWNNTPTSWKVQSEVMGSGLLKASSSQREWNQALIPVIQWGAPK
jgi:hypothetical protein